MKQFTAIFLIAIYFGAFTGTTVNLHYCMGEYQSAEFFESHKEHSQKECSNCGMANKKNCCEHRSFVAKAKNDSYVANSNISFVPEFSNLPTKLSDREIFLSAKHPLQPPKNISPPENIPIFITNCTYRI